MAVFLAVAAGAIESVLANQKHFDITTGLPKNATCKSFIHADEACMKAVEHLDVHKQGANGTKPAMKPRKFAQALKKCYRKKLAKDELHHVCHSQRTVKKVLRCFKKASNKAMKCFLQKFTPELGSRDEEIRFPRAPILRE